MDLTQHSLPCKTKLCNSIASQVEEFRTIHTAGTFDCYDAAAARCNNCHAMYWMYRRNGKIELADRRLPDQRKQDRS